MTKPLSGKVALITGAARGIGKGIALVLAEQGANVVLNDRAFTQEQRGSLAAEFQNFGVRILFVEADVTDEAAVSRMFEAIDAAFGSIDILVNNAGTTQAKAIDEISLEDWNRVMTTNLTSCFLCSKQAIARMKTRKWGRIVNISSMAGQQGALYGHVHYSASKSGMIGFTKTLARTGAPHGISVNAVAPGITETELLLQTHGPEQMKDLLSKIPIGRCGKPRHIGLAVAFLCGEAADFMTGAVIDMNGGIYMR